MIFLIEGYESNHEYNAEAESHKLKEGCRSSHLFMKFRYEVRACHIDEATCSKRDDEGGELPHDSNEVQGKEHAHEGRKCREKIEKKCSPFGEPCKEKDTKISHLVRYLMRHNGDGGLNAEGYA